jgi:hypothetical protein
MALSPVGCFGLNTNPVSILQIAVCGVDAGQKHPAAFGLHRLKGFSHSPV